MRVVDVEVDGGLATCLDADGVRSEVMTGLLDQVAVGDTVLVHAGTALLRLDPHAEERP
jgi:hydrogenase maturation factor